MIHREEKDDFLCNFKSVNYFMLFYWRSYYHSHFSRDEVLFTGREGGIMEGSHTNIMVVKDGRLLYVDPHENYLSGIMQKNILRDAPSLGFANIVPLKGGIPHDLLSCSDEILLTNSLIAAVPVARIHGSLEREELNCARSGWAKKIRSHYGIG